MVAGHFVPCPLRNLQLGRLRIVGYVINVPQNKRPTSSNHFYLLLRTYTIRSLRKNKIKNNKNIYWVKPFSIAQYDYTINCCFSWCP